MYMSQMIFMGDLPASELESLGRSYFKVKNDKAINKAIISGNPNPKLNKYSVNGSDTSQN